MNSHVSSILLGVRDMERSKRFYTEGLGGRSSMTGASQCSSFRTSDEWEAGKVYLSLTA
jgi:hypothetical protein